MLTSLITEAVALEVNSRNKRPLGDKSFTIADGRPKYRHPEATSSDDEVTQAGMWASASAMLRA